MEKIIKIENLLQFENLLKGLEVYNQDSNINPLIYFENDTNNYLIFRRNTIRYDKVPLLADSRFIYALKILETINNSYIEIYDDSGNILFDYNEFMEYRKKINGIKEYTKENFIINDNLYFEQLNSYLQTIDKNFEHINIKREKVISEIIRVLNQENISVTIGNNSGGEVELVEAGSTARGTNVPSLTGKDMDFDFTIRVNPEDVFKVKKILENELKASNSITKTSKYKVRLLSVEIPGLEDLIDIDFSLTPQKEKYLASEDVIKEQLENIKKQDENSYRLVLANIIFAKNYLKKCGVYKPSRGILDGDRSFGGIGGIGIENWILQNGGSFIEAAKSFYKASDNKNFIEFQKEYAILDFGKNHVEVSKHHFPYDNFIMKNMRENGYELMKQSLKKFLEELNIIENNKIK